MPKPLLALATLFSILSLALSVTGQQSNELKSFLDEHYSDGAQSFLEMVYKEIYYPKEARLNCGIGNLHVAVILNPNGQVEFQLGNQFGYGVDENVMSILQMTTDNWNFVNETERIDFTIAYILTNGPEVDGDVVVRAVGPDRSATDSRCLTNKVLLKNINNAILSERFESGAESYFELIRRGDRSDEFTDIRNIYGKKFASVRS